MGAMEAPFPSSAWFVELVSRATSDQAALQRRGIADLRLGVEVLIPDGIDEFFGVVLDGYDIGAIAFAASRKARLPCAIQAFGFFASVSRQSVSSSW